MRAVHVLVAASLLATALAVSAPPTTAGAHAELYSARVAGNASFGVRVETGESGSFTMELIGHPPGTASVVSHGLVLFGEDRKWVFSYVGVGFWSHDRLVMHALPLSGEPPAGIDLRSGGTDADCAYACLELRVDGSPFATHHVLLWAGGVNATSLVVRGDPGAAVAVEQGAAHVLGDAELEQAATNVQVQRSLNERVGAGAKVIRDARVPVTVSREAWGAWGVADFKAVCSKQLGGCLGKDGVDAECRASIGVPCGARASYTGPAGSGSGALQYDFRGAGPGDYTFVLDEKVDAYALDGAGAGGAAVYPKENYSFLTLADVALPG